MPDRGNPTIVVDRSVLTVTLGSVPAQGGGGGVGADLTAIEALTGTGFAARTAADTWALRSFSNTSGLAWTHADGASGNPSVTLDAGLVSLAGVDTGADILPYTTGTNTWAGATLTAAGRAILDDASASAQRTTLGVAIGTDVLAYDAGLVSLAGVDTGADILPYTTGAATWAGATLTSFARTLLDDVDAATARTTLGIPAAAADGWTYIFSTADETDSTASPVEHTQLKFTPDASSTYQIEAFIIHESSGTTIGFRWGFWQPTGGVTYAGQQIGAVSSTTSTTLRNGAMDVAALSGTHPTGTCVSTGSAVLKTTTGVTGQLAVRFASDASPNIVTLLAKSYIRYRKIPF